MINTHDCDKDIISVYCPDNRSTLTALRLLCYLTEGEGVEPQAGQSHAAAKAEQAVEIEGVGEGGARS